MTAEQALPSPLKPGLHVQVKPPLVFVHIASAAQSCAFVEHSSTSVLVEVVVVEVLVDVEVEVLLEVLVVEVLVDVGVELEVEVPVEIHFLPSPLKPGLHLQVKPPLVFVHVA